MNGRVMGRRLFPSRGAWPGRASVMYLAYARLTFALASCCRRAVARFGEAACRSVPNVKIATWAAAHQALVCQVHDVQCGSMFFAERRVHQFMALDFMAKYVPNVRTVASTGGQVGAIERKLAIEHFRLG